MKSKNDPIKPAAYQLVPLTKLLTNGMRSVLICDGVGVGKTISAAYAIVHFLTTSPKPCAVVCPPALLPKWMGELKSKFELVALPVRSSEDLITAKEEAEKGRSQNVYVISNSLVIGTSSDQYPELSLVIFDEIHNYRNNETQTHKGALEVAKAAHWRIGLTATPINNSLNDLASELHLLLPEYGWETIQAAIEDLWRSAREKLTNALVTRFLKERLGVHFAARVVTWRRVAYPESYAAKVRVLVNSLQVSPQTSFDAITYFRLAASSPAAFSKATAVPERLVLDDPKLEALREALSDPSIEHWLVFCEFKETVEYLASEITGRQVFTMTGETPMFERESTLDAFSKTPNSVLIMTSVGSEGLDMQFSQGIVNYDLHWNPMKLEQRIGRIDRLGQKKPWIGIVNLVVQGSIDERVMSVISRKLTAISGSVFAADGILESTTEAEQLYDSSALSEELNESERLVRVLDNNSPIENKDYAVLKAINIKYCRPEMLRRAARRRSIDWIASGKSAKRWLNKVRSDGQRVLELLSYFS